MSSPTLRSTVTMNFLQQAQEAVAGATGGDAAAAEGGQQVGYTAPHP